MKPYAFFLLPLLTFMENSGFYQPSFVDLPDTALARTFERAATKNVLAAVNPKVFYGYWSVCADGQGFGFGNTYPSLDGHQITDALLWLGQIGVVQANWDYVRSFQRADGLLPTRTKTGSIRAIVDGHPVKAIE